MRLIIWSRDRVVEAKIKNNYYQEINTGHYEEKGTRYLVGGIRGRAPRYVTEPTTSEELRSNSIARQKREREAEARGTEMASSSILWVTWKSCLLSFVLLLGRAFYGDRV